MRRQVQVNGVMHPVTDNLYHILEWLWLDRRSQSSDLRVLEKGIWLDVICINQENIEERSRQVKQVGIIYKQAFKTLAWLDYEMREYDASQGLALLGSFATKARESAETEETAAADVGENTLLGPIERNDGSALISLGRVFRSSYWQRLWIIQETVISPNIVFCCRDHGLSSDNVFLGLSWLFEHKQEFFTTYMVACQSRGLNDSTNGLASLVARVGQLMVLREESGGSDINKLRWLMRLSRSVEQTDERDKIYGMLSLFDDGLQNAIHPDYQLSVSQIYTDFARVVVCQSKHLDMICEIRPSNNHISGVPSWVPDWRTSIVINESLIGDIPHHASGSALVEVDFSKHGILSARGFIFDLCDGFSVGLSDINNTAPGGDQRPMCIAPSTAPHKDVYGSYENTRDALWKTVTAQSSGSVTSPFERDVLLTIHGKDAQHSLPNVMENTTVRVYNVLQEWNGELRLGDRSLKEYYCSPSDLQEPLPEQSIYDATARTVTCIFGRKLAISAKGYLGLASSLAQPGDAICILLGCSVPVILRPIHGNVLDNAARLTLVGECYVHGIMNGESMKAAEDDPSVLRTFDIC